MTNLSRHTKRCLLLMPLHFYSFGSVVQKGLVEFGFSTILANDEYPQNMLGRMMSKFGMSPLVRLLTRRVLRRRFLTGEKYDLIIVIKGRGLDDQTIEMLRTHTRQFVGYHFDSFRYEHGPSRWVKNTGDIFTFDYQDADEKSLPVVELFSSMPESPIKTTRKFKISAIMRNHSDRLSYLDKVLRATGTDDSFIYIFESSILTLAFNFMRHPSLYLKYYKYISTRALPYTEYVSAIADSAYTIDYAHPRQTGITIRCFEAASSGTRVITNNPYVMKSPFFTADSVFVLAEGSDAKNLTTQVAINNRTGTLPRRRSVQDFLAELTGLTPQTPIS